MWKPVIGHMAVILIMRNILIIFGGLLTTVLSLDLKEYDQCSPDNDLCTEIESCAILEEPMKNGFKPKICSYKESKPIICCSKQVDYRDDWRSNTSISEKMCLSYLGQTCSPLRPLVYDGVPAKPKELPFMAHIGNGTKGYIYYFCGGTLISKNFVLSVAHCSKKDDLEAQWVRLGDLDISTEQDDAKPEEIRIVERINHPDYRYFLNYHDISLYRLERDVQFNNYIRPICLYYPDSLDRYNKVFAAGWGRTEKGVNSPKLLKVNLELFNISACAEYEVIASLRLPQGLKSQYQICSGRTDDKGDTCVGDSGGPLYLPSQANENGLCGLYRQIGITSFGAYYCATKGQYGMFTKISGYRDWIEGIVWKDEA